MLDVIGLTGHMRAGKDTVAELMAADGWERVGFADALKSMALAIDPFVSGMTRLSQMVEREGWEGAKEEPEVRRLLQALGTEGVREHLGTDAWIAALRLRMGEEGRYVVGDVRFPNEAAAIRSWGGQVWRIARPGYEGDNHPSEAFVDSIEVDRELVNDGSLSHLATLVGA